MANSSWNAPRMPDFSQANSLMELSQRQSMGALEAVSKGVSTYQAALTKKNTTDVMNALYAAKTPEDVASATARAQQLAAQLSGDYDQQQVQTAMDTRPTMLMQEAMQRINYDEANLQQSDKPTTMELRNSLLNGDIPTATQLAQNLGSTTASSNAFTQIQAAQALNQNAANTTWDQNFKEQQHRDDVRSQQEKLLNELTIAGSKAGGGSGSPTGDKSGVFGDVATEVGNANIVGNREARIAINSDGSPSTMMDTPTTTSSTNWGSKPSEAINYLLGGVLNTAESSNRVDARPILKNGKRASTAFGIGQFTEPTWLSYTKNLPEFKGKSDAELLELRKNPDLSVVVQKMYLQDSATKLYEAKVPINPANLYGMYMLGQSGNGFRKFYEAYQKDPNGSTSKSIDALSIRSNPEALGGKTNQQVMDMFQRKTKTDTAVVPAAQQAGLTADEVNKVQYEYANKRSAIDYQIKQARENPDTLAKSQLALNQYISGGSFNLPSIMFGNATLMGSIVSDGGSSFGGIFSDNRDYYNFLQKEVPGFSDLPTRAKLQILVSNDVMSKGKSYQRDSSNETIKTRVGQMVTNYLKGKDTVRDNAMTKVFDDTHRNFKLRFQQRGGDPNKWTKEDTVRWTGGEDAVQAYRDQNLAKLAAAEQRKNARGDK